MTDKQVKQKKVLVIEDDPFLVRAYEIKFKNVGLEADIATNFEEIEAALKRTAPTVILLDLMLPGISGFDILEQIQKKSGDWAKVPVIVVSNLSQPSDIERGKKLGAVEYLVKSNTKFADIAKKVISYCE
jgi:DNA-binding response OmpR family regulator